MYSKMIRKSFPPTLCRLCGLIKSQGTDLCSISAKRTGILLRINKRLSKEKAADEKTSADMTNTFAGIQLKVPDVSCTLLEENRATVSIGPDGKVECKLCQSYLEAVEHTTLHMVTHGIGTVICNCRLCGHQAELAQFLHVGSDKSSVWCETCRFMPVPEKNKQDSKTKLVGRKLYPCEICSKVFRSKAHLARHCIVHSGAKPFLCEVCGTGYGQKSSLKLHVLSHAGLNPHKCEHCGQSFRFKSSLRSHIMSLHWPIQDSGTNQTVYQCDQCDRQFATVYKLRRHYRSHTGERPYECNRCGRLFSQSCNLKLHRKKHEEEDAQSEQYSTQLLVTQQHNTPPTNEQFIAQPDPVLLVDSILQHPVVQCGDLGDPENALSTIDTVLLQSGEKDSDHTSPYVSLTPEYLSLGADGTGTKKAPTELFTHFGHEGLLYMNQTGDMQDTSTSEGVSLPTFSSLQPVSSVSLSNLTH
ncbi:zinc finger protein 124 isoform X2 [Anabrus simplex]|uniref:zinc finger protein 124 isoform X2 n=1 Tax=Anabrus simplex TaxID=316456 RepID=UPI0035A2D800